MPRIFVFILVFHFGLAAISQQATPNTYAVVIGISKYESDGITSLDFAHRDAEEFAKFLGSKAGGSVPEENIRLLLNESATYSAIYDGLYWLLDVSKKNDVVYIYFSGHGDVENNTIYKLGFLLASNTPRFNYVNNAVRIEDVNNVANTISVNNGARVIIITDACRSGNLAGNANRGNFLVGQQLRIARGNEIRISSCGPDELSNEDEGWGGGRGIFSYYLLKGLTGLADSSNDRIVTLNEIKSYLNKSIADDKLMSGKADKQTPVVSGPANIQVAVIDTLTLASMQQQSADNLQVQNSKLGLSSLGISNQGYFFSMVTEAAFENNSLFETLSKLHADSIPFRFISSIVSSHNRNSIDSVKIEKLANSLRQNPDALKRFKEKMVETLADKGQKIINLYLEGDEAELEKRKYYNAYSKGYEVYINMFATAIKLVSPQSPMRQILQVKFHYFSGVVARLKIPLTENYLPLIDEAMKEQQMALKLEENAAYIHNELGILYKLKKNKTKAEEHLVRATEISPTWALPWSNLSGLYINNGDLVKGSTAVEKSLELQPRYQGALLNKALLSQKKSNLLAAEEFYQKSIKVNTRHYLPFERLGYLYLQTTRYREADSNFLEADKRKRGFKINPLSDSDGDGVTDQFDQELSGCLLDTTMIRKDDIMGNFVIGLNYLENGEQEKAEYKFKHVIKLDEKNPLAFHYLGKIFYQQQRWEEGEIFLKYALQYFLDSVQFRSYCDSVFLSFNSRYISSDSNEMLRLLNNNNCISLRFSDAWFKKMHTQFFLGTVYERWNHFSEAEKQFRDIIRDDPGEKAAYFKLWNLFEHTGRLLDAEDLIKTLPDSLMVKKELAEFYSRVTIAYPDYGEWFYKAGNLMHSIYLQDPDRFKDDVNILLDDNQKSVALKQMNVRPINKTVIFTVPGTEEYYSLADEIYYPLTDGITYLDKASRLLSEPAVLAVIYYKLGDLYVWKVLPEKADEAYKRSVELNPDDANTRIKFINTSRGVYNLTTALEQLDSLYARKEISFEYRLLTVKYSIYAGRFDGAKKLLQEAKKIYPFVVNEISNLNGLLQLLSSNPSLAIPFYKELLLADPNNYEVMYTLATLYRKTNNNSEAWKWLASSVKKGFKYYWVLKYDDNWNDFRNSGKWRSLTKDIISKE